MLFVIMTMTSFPDIATCFWNHEYRIIDKEKFYTIMKKGYGSGMVRYMIKNKEPLLEWYDCSECIGYVKPDEWTYPPRSHFGSDEEYEEWCNGLREEAEHNREKVRKHATLRNCMDPQPLKKIHIEHWYFGSQK